METVRDFIFLSSQIMTDGDCNHEIKTLSPWKKSYDQRRQHIKKQRHYFANKGPSRQTYVFSSSQVWMWELDSKESQSRFDARYWMLGAATLGWPRGMVRGGKRSECSGWGTCVYLWRIHVDIGQNQYNIVKLKNKIKKRNKQQQQQQK